MTSHLPEAVGMGEAIIQIQDLVFRYPESTFALTVPRLDINRGEKVVFIGPSGCGKTTLISLIAGIHPISEGKVSVLGRDIPSLNDRSRREFRVTQIGFIFQEFELLDYLTVRENILLPYSINRAMKHSRADLLRADKLAGDTGLGDKLGRHPHELSQGERQRLAICRAMVTEPEILIADEPTGNLDPHTTASALDLMIDQVESHKTTFIVVTHDHSLLDRFDRIIDFSDFGGDS